MCQTQAFPFFLKNARRPRRDGFHILISTEIEQCPDFSDLGPGHMDAIAQRLVNVRSFIIKTHSPFIFAHPQCIDIAPGQKPQGPVPGAPGQRCHLQDRVGGGLRTLDFGTEIIIRLSFQCQRQFIIQLLGITDQNPVTRLYAVLFDKLTCELFGIHSATRAANV